jgi:hypothetical protein
MKWIQQFQWFARSALSALSVVPAIFYQAWALNVYDSIPDWTRGNLAFWSLYP